MGEDKKISEITKPMYNINTKGVVREVVSLRKRWNCFKCSKSGMWKTEDEFSDVCPNCGVKPSDVKNEGLNIQDKRAVKLEDETGSIYLDLWNEDAKDGRIEVGDKVELIGGYSRQTNFGAVNIGKGKSGIINVKKLNGEN